MRLQRFFNAPGELLPVGPHRKAPLEGFFVTNRVTAYAQSHAAPRPVDGICAATAPVVCRTSGTLEIFQQVLLRYQCARDALRMRCQRKGLLRVVTTS